MSIENRNKEQMYGELQAQRTTFEAVRAGLIGKEMGSPDTSSDRELMQLLEKTGLQIEVSALTPAVAEQLTTYAEQAVALAEEHNITPAETEFAVQAAEQAAAEQVREGTGALYLFDRIKLSQPIARFTAMLAVMILLVSGCVMPDVAQAATETPDQATTLDIDDVEQNLNGTSTPTKVPPKKTPTPAKTPVPTKEAQPTPTATPEPLRWQRTLTVQVDSLNIRSDASTSSLSIGSLKKGDVIDEYTRVSKGLNEVWANIGPNQYVAISIDGTEFVLEESTLLNPGKSLGGNELSVQDRAGVVETIKKLDLRGFEDLTDIVPTSTGFDLEDSEGNDVGQIVIRTNGEVAIYQSRAKVAEANEDGLFVNLLSEYLDEIREQHPEVEISSEDAAAILAGEEPAVQITVGTAPNQSLRFFKDGVRWLVEGQEVSPTATATATAEASREESDATAIVEETQKSLEAQGLLEEGLVFNAADSAEIELNPGVKTRITVAFSDEFKLNVVDESDEVEETFDLSGVTINTESSQYELIRRATELLKTLTKQSESGTEIRILGPNADKLIPLSALENIQFLFVPNGTVSKFDKTFRDTSYTYSEIDGKLTIMISRDPVSTTKNADATIQEFADFGYASLYEDLFSAGIVTNKEEFTKLTAQGGSMRELISHIYRSLLAPSISHQQGTVPTDKLQEFEKDAKADKIYTEAGAFLEIDATNGFNNFYTFANNGMLISFTLSE